MREIEVKARIADTQVVTDALSRAGVELGKPLKQRDIVYSEPGVYSGIAGHNFLRVRIQNDSDATFTLKQTVKDLHKIEHETAIDDADEMITMIEMMHFELFNDLTKTRRKAKLGDIEICVDEVKDLGNFIELEKLAGDDVDAEAIREELWAILDSYGVERSSEVTDGYDILMRKKLGL